jgi:hypothetical protein
MLKRFILCQLTILAVALASLPVSQAQTFIAPDRGDGRRPRPMRISSYEDDPFVMESLVRRMDAGRFSVDEDGRPILRSNLVSLSEESKIYRKDPQTGQFKPFAWNPWPQEPTANQQRDFRFPDEERFPLHRVERDSDGKIILKDGLQVWTPNDRRLGSTTTFEAAHAVKDAAEFWAGRDILWGQNGILDIEPHVFIDFNAFYSGNTRTLHFGVAPYRLPGQTEIKIFETATSWEMVGHESGHAVQDTLKPNRDWAHQGFGAWAESFADQTAMWTSLRNRDRVFKLLAETNGALNQSNALTRLGEAFAALTGRDTGIRDAFNDLKVSDTTEEIHDRSRVLTGAAYKIFLAVYSRLRNEQGIEEQEAMRKAGEIMGAFLTRANDYTPENEVTLEDVAKAYLKVDKEFFASRYHATLVDEFTRREIFDAKSVSEWLAHEAATPQLWLHPRWPDHKVEQLIRANLDKLGVGLDFGLKLQSVTRVNYLRRGIGLAQTIVRVQLTQGRGDDAKPLDNHGILVFHASGMLTDYHAPLPPDDYAPLSDAFSQAQALMAISQASQLNLDKRGAALSLVRKPDGQLTVEARVMRGEGINAYLEVFTLDNPQGERREILISPLPPDKRIPIPDDLIN